jgi:drug/metabolite transporter (DMT)-like permease
MVLVGGSVAVSHALAAAPLFTAQAARYAAASLVLLGLSKSGLARDSAGTDASVALAADTRARAATGIALPRGRDWLYLIGIALTGLVLFNVALVRGVEHAEPAVIAVAVASVPVVLGIVGPLVEGHSPARRILVAAVIVTVGSALVEGTGRTDGQGVAWAAVALFGEASFTLLAVPVLPRLGPWGVSLHTSWLAAALLAIAGLVVEGPAAVTRLTAEDWAALAYQAVMVTAVAFVLWYSTVAAFGAARVGLLTGIAPVSAAMAGTLTDGRVPSLLVWTGILVVAAGLAVGLRGESAAARGR